MFLDKQTGDLTFKAVQLSDSDVYTCQVTYKGAAGEDTSAGNASPSPEVQQHTHQLDVVAETIPWLRFSVIYSGNSCDHEEMTLIQENVVQWVHRYACFFCPVRNSSVSCIAHDARTAEEDGAYRDIRIRFALSTLGLEHKMTAFSGYSEACPLSCVESLHMKILQIARNSLEKLFRLESMYFTFICTSILLVEFHSSFVLIVELESSQNDISSTFSPQPETIESDLAVGCPSGFFVNYKLCCKVFENVNAMRGHQINKQLNED
jgi:hypothetical protein